MTCIPGELIQFWDYDNGKYSIGLVVSFHTYTYSTQGDSNVEKDVPSVTVYSAGKLSILPFEDSGAYGIKKL
jgi:hypothetical protein